MMPSPSIIVLLGMVYALRHPTRINDSLNVPSWRVIVKGVVPFKNSLSVLSTYKDKQLTEEQVKAIGKFYKNVNYKPDTLTGINESITALRDALHLLIGQKKYSPWLSSVLKSSTQIAEVKQPSDCIIIFIYR